MHGRRLGSSNVRNKKLRSMREVVEFIIEDGQYGDLRIKYKDGMPFLKTDGIEEVISGKQSLLYIDIQSTVTSIGLSETSFAF